MRETYCLPGLLSIDYFTYLSLEQTVRRAASYFIPSFVGMPQKSAALSDLNLFQQRIQAFAGITEQHTSVFFDEQRIVDSGVTCRHTAL